MGLINHKRTALAKVRVDGLALQHVNPRLRNDTQVVRVALCQNPHAIEFAGEKLLDDHDFLINLLEDCDVPLVDAYAVAKYASERLRGNYEFALEIVSRDVYTIEYLSEEVRSATAVVELLIEESTFGTDVMRSIPELVRNNFEVMLKFVEANGLNLEHLSWGLRDNDLLVEAAVKQNSYAIAFASDRLKRKKEIVALAVAGLLEKTVNEVLDMFNKW